MIGPRRPRGPSRPNGFDDVPELTPEEVERRVDLRGGGMPLAPVERPVREVRDLRRKRSGRTVARESLLLLGLAVVGLVTVRLVLPDGPLTASESNAPSGSAAAIGSFTPPTLGPLGTPYLVTLPPIASPSGAPGPSGVPPTGAAPTPEPEPTPTLRPGQTPRPTPVPTRTPTPTVGPTAPNRATVIVKMIVINNSGGSAVASDWQMSLIGEIGTSIPNSFPGSQAGTPVSVPAGKGYRVIDDASQAGYAARLSSPDCLRPEGGGLVAGTTVTCTITRNDRPRVRVITDVINDNGGSATAGDVSVTVSGANAAPSSFNGSEAGVVVVVWVDLTYGVTQSSLSGYAKSSSGACSGSLGVDAPIAECTFTFNDEPPPPTEPPPTDAPPPETPLAWLLPVWGAALLGGRRWWTTLRSR